MAVVMSVVAVAEALPPQITTASAVIVMEADSGRILYGENINNKLAMASTTKIMTTIILLEQQDIDTPFVVEAEPIMVEGSSMGLREGDTVTLRDLAYGMMLPSGNDAANVTALRIGGSYEAFAKMMNDKALELGLYDTSFVTPSGLDAPEHYTTARDLALLTQYAMENPVFREIAGLSYATVEFGNPPEERTLKNYNKLLESYSAATGVKTGLTDDAGRCLVTSATLGMESLIVVTLNCNNDYQVHRELYDYYFAKLDRIDISYITDSLDLSYIGIEPEFSQVLHVTLYPEQLDELTIDYNIVQWLQPPIAKGEYLGEMVVSLEGQVLLTSQIYSDREINIPQPEKKQSLLDRLKGIFI